MCQSYLDTFPISSLVSPVPHDIDGIHYADISHCSCQLGAVKQNASYIFGCSSINPDSSCYTIDILHWTPHITGEWKLRFCNEYYYLANVYVNL